VSPDLSIAEWIDRHLLHSREQTFAVSDGTTLQGLIALDHVKRVPRAEWTTRRVRDAMTPLTQGTSLTPNETAAAALARLVTTDATELPVIDTGQLVGFFGHSELSRFLKLKAEIGRN
jgi:CBS domain-containing protein